MVVLVVNPTALTANQRAVFPLIRFLIVQEGVEVPLLAGAVTRQVVLP